MVTDEEEARQQDESDDSAETLIYPYTDPEESDSEEEGYALSRWSESSSSSSSSGDEDSDFGTEEGGFSAGAVLMPFPSWGRNIMSISALLSRGDSTDEGGNDKLATVEEEDEEERDSNHDGAAVEAVEEEYGRPWGGPIPRWKRLRSSDSLPMYNLGPRDFHHGSSKLKRASCPDDDDSEEDSDSDSDCSMVSPMSTEEGFDADAQVFAVVEVVEAVAVVPMEGVQWQD